MAEEGVPVFGIIDPLSTRYGNTLTGKFLNGNELSLAAFRPVLSTTRPDPTEHAGKDEVTIFHVKPQFIFDDPILRSLVAEANSTFYNLQSVKKRGTKTDFLQISRTYRSIIRACLEKLQDEITQTDEHSENNNKYNNFISTFYSIECIWHLSEILFIDQSPTNIVIPQLLEWIRFHFPASERIATDLLLLGREANSNDNYWPALKGLIMQGQIEVTRAILQLHPLAESPSFRMAEQILKAMPTYNLYGGFSIQKFRSQWQYWLTDTERKILSDTLSDEPHLEDIIKLVTGNTEIWNKYITESQYWYELLPGYLFYTEPACKHFELGNLANNWLNRWIHLKEDTNNEAVQLKQLDRIILNLMEYDMHQMIFSIQLIADNQWFVTHLIDLLYHSGQLKIVGEHQLSDCIKLRESLLFEFGSCLMSRNAMWMLGMDYLEYCGKEGLGAMQVFLTKIPIKTEKLALKIISLAKSKGFSEVEAEICKVQAKRSFSDERYGNALEWAIRSNDAILVTSIADFILKHYSKTGEIICQDVIANIGAKMFVSPRLVFLVKYYDFYEFYRKRDFLPAAELLINLLDSQITPEYFWPSLLVDTIPLLESKDPKILAKDTCTVLHHLESDLVPLIEKKRKRLQKFPEEPVNILKDYRIENMEEIITLLRLACARNLSRAIIIESTELD